MADYEPILRKAIGQLDRPSAAQRDDIYDRARLTLLRHLDSVDPPRPEAEIDAQRADLEAAIARVEQDFAAARAAPLSSVHRFGSANRGFWPIAAGIVLAALLSGVGYYFFAGRQDDASEPAVSEAASAAPPAAEAPAAEAPVAEAQPSTASATVPTVGPSYVLRRQNVFYRTTHPAGTVIISRSQRFLYLVQPNHVAVRYTIGVGPECNNIAGLFRIVEKVEQPASAMPAVAGSAGIDPRFGPRVIRFEERRSVHGTSEPDRIGRSATFGCFHSWNNDVVDLYDRVQLQGRLVVMN